MTFRAVLVRVARYAWASPWTLAGLLVATAALALGGSAQCRLGAIEVHGGWIANGCRRLPPQIRFEAITFGHVILALDRHGLDSARAHEQVHVRQYERWGPLFVPAYLAASAWLWLRGGRPYLDNPFEREAYALAPLVGWPDACKSFAEPIDATTAKVK